MLGSLWANLRYAVRRLGASPGFTAAAVVTISIGVGIDTGIFSVSNGVALCDPLDCADRAAVLWIRANVFFREPPTRGQPG